MRRRGCPSPAVLRYLAAWGRARRRATVWALLEQLAAAGPLLSHGMSYADALRERLALPVRAAPLLP